MEHQNFAGSSPIHSVMVDGRYELLRRLGEGGQAAVFAVRDHRLNVDRALKAMRPELARRAALRSRFEAEAHTLAELDHPNLVRVFDVSASGRTAWFVMEQVPGGSLMDHVARRGPLGPATAVRAALQVCAGVGAAHARGIVHRDIKPHNVLVARDGTIKLVDFGIARTVGGHRTRAHSPMGTTGFVAPEQLRDARSVDGRADVFGIGTTLFVLATGTDPLRWLRFRRHDALPEPLRAVIDRATEDSPEDRYPTVEHLADALVGCLPHLSDPRPALTFGDGWADSACVAEDPEDDEEEAVALAEYACWFTGSPLPTSFPPVSDRTEEEAPAPSPPTLIPYVMPEQDVSSLDGPTWIAEPPRQRLHGFEVGLQEAEREASDEAAWRRLEAEAARERRLPWGAVGLAAVVMMVGSAAAGLQHAAAADREARVAEAEVRTQVQDQQPVAALLASIGADSDLLARLFDDYAGATDEAGRGRAAAAIDAALHAEAERVLVQGSLDAVKVTGSLDAFDHALHAWSDTHPGVLGVGVAAPSAPPAAATVADAEEEEGGHRLHVHLRLPWKRK